MRHGIISIAAFAWCCFAQQQQQQDAAPAPGPPAESATTGSFEFGYREVVGQRGSADAYRSVVNLGSGPKLLNFDFRTLRPKSKALDRIELRGASWGGDPYNHVSATLSGTDYYRLNLSYRNLAQFNRLPSFAVGTQALDTRRRDSDLELELFPNRSVVPFFGWTASAGTGVGLTNFSVTGNEYPIAGRLEDVMHLIRGGVRVDRRLWRFTVEQGGLRYRQNDAWAQSSPNPGRVATPFFGQRLQLNSLDQLYRVTGSGSYSKAVFSANPASWVDVSASFLFSQPRTEIDFTEVAGGNFALLNPLRFSSSLAGAANQTTKMPHTSGWLAVELRPHDRVRIVESWFTDRMHNAADPLRFTWSRQQLEGFFDLVKGITVHGGHRYEWADSQARLPVLGGPSDAQLRRHIGLGGVRAQFGRVQGNVDYEQGASNRVLYRTSWDDYRRLRGQLRVQPTAALSLQAHWSLLDNATPSVLGVFDWLSRTQGLAATWTPKKGGTILASYSRSTIDSRIPYLEPQDLFKASSIYKENGHSFTGMWEGGSSKAFLLGLGGTAFVSSGTRPTRLWEPIGRATVPVHKHVSARAEWRWHGLTQPFYLAESFRAHLLTLSVITTWQ